MKKNIDLMIASAFITYYFYLRLFFGGISFDEIFLILGIALIIYHKIKGKINRKLYRFLKLSFTTLLTVFLILESVFIFYPKRNIKDDCDYLIVLGAAVKNNTPSLTLKGRLDSAIEYINKTNDDCYIVVSGGKGSGENVSEAFAMKEYLINNGINRNIIIEENMSKNTYENFEFSKKMIENHSKKEIQDLNIKVVTTDFHAFRSSILAKKNRFTSATFYTSKSKASFVPVYYIREFFAFTKMLILW